MNQDYRIPTADELTAEAAAEGYALRFEYHTTSFEDVWVNEGDTQHLEHIKVLEYQGYADGIPYGIWVRVSTEPEKLHHGFYVVHSEDGAPTDGVAYETVRAALERISRLIDRQNV